MSTTEKRAWTEVILWSLPLAFVWMRFTAGWEVARNGAAVLLHRIS